jgi:molybdenum-dependent DNA-binding transcriptional regulator ModE
VRALNQLFQTLVCSSRGRRSGVATSLTAGTAMLALVVVLIVRLPRAAEAGAHASRERLA